LEAERRVFRSAEVFEARGRSLFLSTFRLLFSPFLFCSRVSSLFLTAALLSLFLSPPPPLFLLLRGWRVGILSADRSMVCETKLHRIGEQSILKTYYGGQDPELYACTMR